MLATDGLHLVIREYIVTNITIEGGNIVLSYESVERTRGTTFPAGASSGKLAFRPVQAPKLPAVGQTFKMDATLLPA